MPLSRQRHAAAIRSSDLQSNEGERQRNAINPAGSISLIQFNAGAPAASVVSTLGFGAWDGQEALLRSQGVRIQAGVSASIALEPEYIAVSADGRSAHVTLQEANAIAIIDLASATPSVTQRLRVFRAGPSSASKGVRSRRKAQP